MSDIQEILTINGIVALAAGSLGFIIRKLWDTWSERREKRRVLRLRERIDFLENALKKFYWPLYIMLCKDIIVWQQNKNLQDENVRKRSIRSLENSIVLPNHCKILRKVRRYSHLAQPDASFKEQILLYIKYASLYITIRKSGDKTSTPKDFGAPFPSEFIKIIERNTNELQSEYNTLLGVHYDKENFINKKVASLLGRVGEPLQPLDSKNIFQRTWYRIKNCCKSKKDSDVDLERGRELNLASTESESNYYTSNKLL